MINYVIINGVNSNTKNGLGINELPPITKPSMRTQTEEIDGRDGDIITKLGYSAYDKTITIGLFGTGYDVNDIISFFTSEGTITFSNEPDKYYKFTMLEQIDVESLLRFKTASITFHCQPFKYPLTETPLEIEYDYIEQTGETLTLNNTGESILDLSLKGNTSQTGTPTPDTPIPINVVSGDNEVVVCGKNLLNLDRTLGTPSNTAGPNTTKRTYNYNEYVVGLTNNNYYYPSNIVYYSFGNNTVTIEPSSTGYGVGVPFKVKPNTTYTLSYNTDGLYTNNTGIAFYQSDGTYIDRTDSDNTNNYLTFTTQTNCDFVAIIFRPPGTKRATYTNIMLNEGNEATTYEPYQSNSVLLTLGDKEICKIGNYENKIFKAIKGNEIYDGLSVEEKNTLDYGKWYLRKAIGKVVLNGSESGWIKRGSSTNSFIKIQRPLQVGGNICLSDKFIYNGSYDVELEHILVNSQWNENLVAISVDRLTENTLNGAKQWLSVNLPNMYYPLATPTNEKFNDIIQEQLEDIYYNMLSYEGQTNISQVNNDKPFIISAKALEQGSDEVVVNNIGNATSKPLIALEGTGNINIYLDGTQVLQANVEDKMNIDIDKLEAYNPDTSVLLNRQVIGNYNSMTIPSGESIIKIDGNLTSATITNYQRWL